MEGISIALTLKVITLVSTFSSLSLSTVVKTLLFLILYHTVKSVVVLAAVFPTCPSALSVPTPTQLIKLEHASAAPAAIAAVIDPLHGCTIGPLLNKVRHPVCSIVQNLWPYLFSLVGNIFVFILMTS